MIALVAEILLVLLATGCVCWLVASSVYSINCDVPNAYSIIIPENLLRLESLDVLYCSPNFLSACILTVSKSALQVCFCWIFLQIEDSHQEIPQLFYRPNDLGIFQISCLKISVDVRGSKMRNTIRLLEPGVSFWSFDFTNFLGTVARKLQPNSSHFLNCHEMQGKILLDCFRAANGIVV